MRSPDWAALTALLDALCREKGLLTRSGTPSSQRLAGACHLTPDVVTAWHRRPVRPSRVPLERVARYAGAEVGPWLRAGGFMEETIE